jgi:Na+-driven multidrug efflux pump
MQSVSALTAELWRLAWPAIIRNFLNCASDRATLALVGHYDRDEAHYDGQQL